MLQDHFWELPEIMTEKGARQTFKHMLEGELVPREENTQKAMLKPSVTTALCSLFQAGLGQEYFL
jgi:hypothetical protein